MHSNVDDDQSREGQMKSYFERQGLAAFPVVLDQAEEEDDDSKCSITQPDGSDPGCDVLGFGSVRLGLPEPDSPAPNAEDISGEDFPVLSPGCSSVMDSEPGGPATPSREQEDAKPECSVATTNDDLSMLLDKSTVVVDKVLLPTAIIEAPVVQGEETGEQNHDETTLRVTTEAPAAIGTTVAMASVDIPIAAGRSLTPPGMWPCKVPGCEAGPFRAKWQLTSHQAVHTSERRFPCLKTGCSRRFRRKNELARHEKSVHRREGVLICPYCPLTEHRFPRMDNLRRHMTRAHPHMLDEWQQAQASNGLSRGRGMQ